MTQRSSVRRSTLAAGIAALSGIWAGPGRAQAFPSRPIRIVSFVPTGSAADALLRAMTREVEQSLGAELVVENKPGGSGAVAVDTVRGAAPDGHTLLLAGSSVMLSTMLRRNGADAFVGLEPVCQVISTPTVLSLRSDLGVRNVDELIRMVRARPGSVSYATVGAGSYAHVMMELFSRRAGVQFLHVPYPQLGQAITDAVSGRLDGVFSLVGTMRAQAAAGQLVFIGLTGTARTPVAPDVPTFLEGGYPDLGVNAWNGLLAPAGTPASVLEKLGSEFAKAAKASKVKEFAAKAALDATVNSPGEFREMLAKERGYWQRVIEETGVRPQ